MKRGLVWHYDTFAMVQGFPQILKHKDALLLVKLALENLPLNRPVS